MDTDSTQHQLLATLLPKLERPIEHLIDYRLLQSGLSGASLYHLRFSDHDAVLKFTLPSAGPLAIERSQREYAFFQSLAADVPVRVPKVLAAHSDSSGVALLFPRYHSSPAPERWPIADFREAARQLGQLHAAFWNKTDGLAHLPWLQPQRQLQMISDMRHANRAWLALHRLPGFAHVLTPARYAWVCRVVAAAPLVDRILQSLPLTLCHGDSTTSNVLRDAAGRFIWADWQVVCQARGPEDLAFFLQRARIAGARVAYDDALSTYRASVEALTGEQLAEASLRRAVDAAEWWSRTLHWPAYMAHSSDAQLAEMLQAIEALVERLEVAL